MIVQHHCNPISTRNTLDRKYCRCPAHLVIKTANSQFLMIKRRVDAITEPFCAIPQQTECGLRVADYWHC